MLSEQANTAVIEFEKKETGIMEHPLTENDLTHPGLYRLKRNSMPCFSYTPVHSCPTSSNTQAKDSTVHSDWDLYPGLIRGIENNGSPEQVKKLHEMQRNL